MINVDDKENPYSRASLESAESDTLSLDEEQHLSGRSRSETMTTGSSLDESVEIAAPTVQDQRELIQNKGGTAYLAGLKWEIYRLEASLAEKQATSGALASFIERYQTSEKERGEEEDQLVKNAQGDKNRLSEEIKKIEYGLIQLNRELKTVTSIAPWDKKLRADAFFHAGKMFGRDMGPQVTRGCCSLFGTLLDGAQATPAIAESTMHKVGNATKFGGAAALEAVAGPHALAAPALDLDRVAEIRELRRNLQECELRIGEAFENLKRANDAHQQAVKKLDAIPKLYRGVLRRVADGLRDEKAETIADLKKAVVDTQEECQYYERYHEVLAQRRSTLETQLEGLKGTPEYESATSRRVTNVVRNAAGWGARALRGGGETASRSSDSVTTVTDETSSQFDD